MKKLIISETHIKKIIKKNITQKQKFDKYLSNLKKYYYKNESFLLSNRLNETEDLFFTSIDNIQNDFFNTTENTQDIKNEVNNYLEIIDDKIKNLFLKKQHFYISNKDLKSDDILIKVNNNNLYINLYDKKTNDIFLSIVMNKQNSKISFKRCELKFNKNIIKDLLNVFQDNHDYFLDTIKLFDFEEYLKQVTILDKSYFSFYVKCLAFKKNINISFPLSGVEIINCEQLLEAFETFSEECFLKYDFSIDVSRKEEIDRIKLLK